MAQIGSEVQNKAAGELVSKREECARALCADNGDNWDDLPEHKSDWVREHGEFNGRFRDVNEPFRTDYFDMVDAVLACLSEPSEVMLAAGRIQSETGMKWQAMLKAVK